MGKKYKKIVTAQGSDTLFSLYENKMGTYTMNIVLGLDMVIEKPKLDEAINRLIKLAPILKGVMINKTWRDIWVEASAESIEKILTYNNISEKDIDQNDKNGFLNKYENDLYKKIDIYTEPPLKIAAYQTEKRILLIFTLHHSVTDGIGFLGIVKIFCEILSELYNLGKIKTKISKNRGISNLITSIKIHTIPKILKQTKIESKIPLKREEVGPITKMECPNISDNSTQLLSKLVISQEEFQTIKEYAKKQGITINDYIISSFIALSREMEKKINVNSKFLGAGVLVNLRRFIPKKDLILANFVGASTVLFENNEALDNFESCAKVVSEQTNKLKNEFIGLGFFLIPALMFSGFPIVMLRKNGLTWAENFIRGWTDRIFQITNLGNLKEYFEAFEGKINYASFLGPFQKNSLPTVSVSTYNDILSIFFSHTVNDFDKGKKELDFISERLRYYLLEWAKVKK